MIISDFPQDNVTHAELEAVQTAVDGKAASGHTHTVDQITDFPASLPASDVHDWAKAATKPSYTAADVGAAPDGYGLGGNATLITDGNEAVKTGWYSWGDTATNLPFRYGGMMVIFRDNSDSLVQLAFKIGQVNDHIIAIRQKYNVAWGAWVECRPEGEAPEVFLDGYEKTVEEQARIDTDALLIDQEYRLTLLELGM